MQKTIAHLGPPGTYAEAAAIAWVEQHQEAGGDRYELRPYSSIAQTLKAVASQETTLAIAPVENSIQGSVTMTLDALWTLSHLQIQQALVLPIRHTLLSWAKDFSTIETVYSHPQALAQCQEWLEKFLPNVQLVPTNATTESLAHLDSEGRVAAIASQRAATLYNLPTLATAINDRPENCTRFWVLGLDASPGGSHTSIAFDLPANTPGALLKPLEIISKQGVNMSRIESRPTKRSLGEYLFFIDLETDMTGADGKVLLQDLRNCTETLKVFGSYSVLPLFA